MGIIVLGLICYAAVRVISLRRRKHGKRFCWFDELVKILFWLYIIMVISVTLFPLGIGFGEFSFRDINFIPLVSIISDISRIGTAYDGDTAFLVGLIVKNVGGNILLLMPLGFLAPILRARCRGLKNTLVLGFLVSFSIECLQLVELLFGAGLARVVDIDDIIFNVLGAGLGYLVYKLAAVIWHKIKTPSKIKISSEFRK